MSTSIEYRRHSIFLSYHDGRGSSVPGDYDAREEFERRFCGELGPVVPRSVREGDISADEHPERIIQRIREEYLSQAAVTIVLVGKHTWRRKFVDWEISATLRGTPVNPRGGLLGILLPSFEYDRARRTYDKRTIPQRLAVNAGDVRSDPYAVIRPWPENGQQLREWVGVAYRRKNDVDRPPNNTLPPLTGDLGGDRW